MRYFRMAAVAALMTLTRCGGQHPIVAAPTPADSHSVVIYEYTFKPQTLTVPAGTTVTWVNRDVAPHSATHRSYGDEPFDSGQMYANAMFRHTFVKAGSYDYLCIYHQGMTGTIVVQ